MGSDIFPCDLLSALLDVCNFVDIAAPLKDRKGLRDFASGGMRYGLAEIRIALAANGLPPGNQHPPFLHLINWSPRFARVMLALVADEHGPLDAFLVCVLGDPIDLPFRSQAPLCLDPSLF